MGKEGIFFTLLGSRPAAPSKICQTLFFPGHVVLDVPKHSVLQHSCTSANKKTLYDDFYSEQCTGNYVDFFALLIQFLWRRPQKFLTQKWKETNKNARKSRKLQRFFECVVPPRSKTGLASGSGKIRPFAPTCAGGFVSKLFASIGG